MAEKAEITGKYLGLVERGEVSVSVKVLEKLADELGFKVTDFFEFDYQLSPEEQTKELLRMAGMLQILNFSFCSSWQSRC